MRKQLNIKKFFKFTLLILIIMSLLGSCVKKSNTGNEINKSEENSIMNSQVPVEKKVIQTVYPQGKLKAFTVSFDDGTEGDRELVEMLKKYNIKGTFNIGSGLFGKQGAFNQGGIDYIHNRITAEEVESLYKGFEVAGHGVGHLPIGLYKPEQEASILNDVTPDLAKLSELVGYDVKGWAYAGGSYSE